MPAASTSPDSFVGRLHELDEIRSGLHNALSGSGRLILLSGEAGIGKTRLAEELAQEARSRGARVAWGRCWEGGGAPPYWPWVQIVRETARQLGPQWLEEMGAPARCVAQMLPELRPALPAANLTGDSPGTPLPTISDRPEQARFQLFDSISTLLRSAATANPLLLIIDDLHSADSDSLLFLNFLARDLPQSRILAIGTYREDEASRSAQYAELLGRIVREAQCFPLRGLNREEISEFIQRRAGVTANQKFVASLSEITEGSPFFLNEIVRVLKSQGRLVSPGPPDAQFAIPESIRAAVGHKLTPLSEAARFALTVASVIGSEFEFALLERASELTHDQLAESLAQAVALGVVVESAGAPVSYRFSHAIIPEVLRADISKPRLLQLHDRIAHGIEQLHDGDLDEYAAALAFHYRQVLSPDDRRANRTAESQLRKKVVAYAQRGAERSVKQLAYDDAVRHYRMALETLGGESLQQPQRVELLLGLGEALRNAGSWSDASQSFAQATELARGLGIPDLLARTALAATVSSTLIFGTPVDPEMVDLLREALDAIGDHDSGVRASLLARLAEESAEFEHRDHALALCEGAIEIARRVRDTGALVSALWTQHQLHWGPHDIEKRLESATEIIRLAEKAGALDWSLRARQSRLAALIELGRIYEADREVEACAALEQRTGQSTGITQRYSAMRCLMRGDFAEAERHAMEVLGLAQRLHDQALEASAGTVLIQIRWEEGRVAETEPMLQAYAAQFPTLPIARCGLADAHSRMDLAGQARNEFEVLASDDFSGISPDWNWIVSMTSLASVCCYLRDERRAAMLYDLLRPYGQRNVTIGWGNVSFGSVEHWLGRLASILGRFDQAESHYNAALRFNAEMGAAPLVARTRYEYGAMLLQRGRDEDRQQGLLVLQQAADTASALGMHELEREARILIPDDTTPRSVSPSSPVERPGAVAHKSQRAIASVLFTDLVRSSERASELKDRKWVELLQRFHLEQRKEIAGLGGRQINTTGDGMLAVFNHPAEAIRCAFAIIASAGRLGLEVTSGIHTGEIEFVGDDVAGIAVHIGARVAAQAKSGEVLVSSTVRDLLSGGELTFVDHGVTALKGIPGEWRLYSVEKRS